MFRNHESYSRVQVNDVEDLRHPKLLFSASKIRCINQNIQKNPQLIETLLYKYSEKSIRCLQKHPELHIRKQLDIYWNVIEADESSKMVGGKKLSKFLSVLEIYRLICQIVCLLFAQIPLSPHSWSDTQILQYLYT